jgi:hypothetical protein
MSKTSTHRIAILAGAVALPLAANAHHAFTGVFDMQNITELNGELTELLWRNPHVRFSIRTAEGETWEIETNSVSILRRMDISPDIMSVGDNITVAGFPARNGNREMWVNNVLLADGREVVTRPGVEPYFSDGTLGTSEIWLAEGTEASESNAQDLGIFRVWSTHFTGPSRSLFIDDMPLTAAAAAARADFDPVADDPIGDCTPKGMPWIMAQPYPVEFVDEGDVILFRIEEYDAVRRIHLNPATGSVPTPSKLGYSRGRWVGQELHVETSAIDWPYFDSSGIPQSADIELYERFYLNADGSELHYELTATDPATFTESVTLDKAWMWRPGEVVRPYECTPSE